METLPLRQSEEPAGEDDPVLKARILDLATDSIVVVDEDGRFLFVNATAYRSRGYTRAEFLAMDVRGLDTPEFAARVAERVRQVFAEGHVVFESAHVCKDGTVMPVEVSSRVIDYRGRRVILSSIRDITERKQAERDLERRSAELKGWIEVLERRNRQISQLAEMAKALQECRTEDEAWSVAGAFASLLFPLQSGSLMARPEAGPLREVGRWGAPMPELVAIAPEDCWALRLRRAHAPTAALDCRHLAPAPRVCLPMTARGELFGVLVLEPRDTDTATPLPEPVRELAQTVAEQVSLAIGSLRLREQLREQATHDALTGLFNRRYMEEALDRELRRAARSHGPVGLLMLDLDRFKDYNDSRGHEAGDDLLRTLGTFLRGHVRAEDQACRYGGEEFVVLLPGAAAAEAQGRAEQLRQEFVEIQSAEAPVTISIGGAIFPSDGASPAALLRSADLALYRAKTLGRNRVEMFTPA